MAKVVLKQEGKTPLLGADVYGCARRGRCLELSVVGAIQRIEFDPQVCGKVYLDNRADCELVTYRDGLDRADYSAFRNVRKWRSPANSYRKGATLK